MNYKEYPLKDIFYLNKKSLNPNNYKNNKFIHYSLPSYDHGGEPKVESANDIKSNKYLVLKPSLLVSKLNPRINRVWHIDEIDRDLSSICSTEFMVYQAKSDDIVLEYYYQFFKSKIFQNYLLNLQSGSTGSRLRVTPSDTLTIAIPKPSKLEQQKIASILSSVDEAIGKTKEIIKKTELVKKSLMNQLLIKGIKHINFKDTVFGKVPEEWSVLQLEDVTSYEDKYSFVGGPFGSDLTAKEYTEHGVRIVQLQNIGDGKFYDNYKIYTSKEKADQLYKSNIFPGDIIIAKMADPVARACIIPDKEDRYLMASDGIRLKVDENKFNKKFILYAINSSYFRKQAINHSTGTTRLRIGLKTLRSLKVLIPSLMEQQKIVSILDSYENKLNVESNKLENLISIKRGLMQQLLTGKVRVPTTENKEVPQ